MAGWNLTGNTVSAEFDGSDEQERKELSVSQAAVTPAEHLCLPNAQDVLDGLMATKIAAHAADIAKKVPHARDMDDKMGQARRKLDWDAMWKCALDPVTGKKRYEESPAATEGTCTMCGKMCAVRTVNKVFEGTTIDLGMED